MLDVRLAKLHVRSSSKNERECTHPTSCQTRSAKAWTAGLHDDLYSRRNGMAQRNLSSDKFEVPSKLRLRLGGINSFVAVSLRNGANQLERITRSDSLVNHSPRTSGCEQSLKNFGSFQSPSGSNATRNYTALMASSQRNRGGKTLQTRLWQCNSQQSVMYPQRTVLCCTMLASRKFSNGRRSTWTLILPLLM